VLYAGVMSGTSLDGVDVAVVQLDGDEEQPNHAELIGFRTVPYEAAFRDRLLGVLEGGGPAELCELNFALGRRFAEAVDTCFSDLGISPGDVAAIGSHGQTLWHAPPGELPGSTLQLGEAAVIAESLGVPVVADLRVRDVAAGGQGAPLTPYFDRLLLSSPTRARAIQNIGGMANVTWLPASDRASSGPGPIAFDTGPGVALIDEAVRVLTAGDLPFDRDGEVASEGVVLEEPLAEWLTDPFFQLPPPRSTGRERFGGVRLRGWLERYSDRRREDLVATLTELTVRTIVGGYRLAELDPDEVCMCGGGARNPDLLRRLDRLLPDVSLRPLEELGWDGDAREAAAFALLARQHHLRIRVDLSWATGALGARILGKWVPA
jgi:anhydro-N-acetylmuramic acid kinase